MTIDVTPYHIFITVLAAVHRQVIIGARLVLNIVKLVELLFKLIFAFLGLAVPTTLAIAGYLIVLLVDTDAHLSNTFPLMLSQLLIITVAILLSSYNFLLLSPTASFVELWLLLLLMDVTADSDLLMRDLWKL